MKPVNRHLNIHHLLNISFLSAIIMALLIFTLFYFIERRVVTSVYSQLNTHFTANMRNFVADRFTIYEKEISGIARTISKNNTLEDIINGKRNKKIESSLLLLPDAHNMIVSDIKGDFRHVPELPEHTKSNEYNRLIGQMLTRFVNYGARPQYLAAPDNGTFSGQKGFSVSSAIMQQDSKLVGVLSVAIPGSTITNRLNLFLSPSSGTVYIIDSKGNFITGDKHASAISPDWLTGNNGTFSTNKAYYYYHHLTHPDWYILHEIPRENFDAQVDIESRTVIYAALFSLLILLICWLSMHWIVRKMQAEHRG